MIAALRTAFARDAFVDVTAAIPREWRARVSAEVTSALDAHAVRRDVRIAVTGESPRRYRIVGRDTLTAICPLAAEIYRSETLLALVGEIAGEPVAPVPHVPEELIATRLEAAGDTHGWHWDDYGFALVWVLRAPSPADGAALELVPDVAWNKSAPRIEAILGEREPVREHVRAGTVYLLRADTTLHRVAPLRRDVLRDALCFSYAAVSALQREVSHETLDAILSEPAPHRPQGLE
ncbi:MAG TPA: hypothetical protein VIJ64_11710 [Candidatus Lustribacter sp.]